MAKKAVQEKAQRLYEGLAVEKIGEGEYRVTDGTGKYTVLVPENNERYICECGEKGGYCQHCFSVAACVADERIVARLTHQLAEYERIIADPSLHPSTRIELTIITNKALDARKSLRELA